MSGPCGHRRWLLVGLGSMALAACTTPATLVPAAGRSRWSGRLALTVDSEPRQSYSASFELGGTPETGELTLFSPLGNTLASIRWSPAGAQLQQGERITRRADLDSLSAELTGAPLPVLALFDWLQGQPSSAAGWEADLQRHADGRVVARRLRPEPTAELKLVFEH